MAAKQQGRNCLIGIKRVARALEGILSQRIDTEIDRLGMKPTIKYKANRRDPWFHHDQPAPRAQNPYRLIQEPHRPGNVVQDVEEDDVVEAPTHQSRHGVQRYGDSSVGRELWFHKACP